MKTLWRRLKFCIVFFFFGGECSDLQVAEDKNTFTFSGYIVSKWGVYIGYHFRENKGKMRKKLRA